LLARLPGGAPSALSPTLPGVCRGALSSARADDDRRDAVPHAPTLVARADPRRCGGSGLVRDRCPRCLVPAPAGLVRAPAVRLVRWLASSESRGGRRSTAPF